MEHKKQKERINKMNIQEIVNDPALWKELIKAYGYAAPYKSQVQFRLALITMPATHITPDYIYNDNEGAMVCALTGWICDDLL